MSDRLQDLEDRIKRLEETLFPLDHPRQPWIGLPTPMPIPATTKCHKCGRDWSGVMGLVCTTKDCPVQAQVTC